MEVSISYVDRYSHPHEVDVRSNLKIGSELGACTMSPSMHANS